ncbi:MAG TPA: FKBP-type peptidyl-prolyl cis-trans isomerase [Bacteroidales bacterium]|nr:FKBP-type peptidyl-prolyl cis-trans isomerase [Bacteroidales bacterium]
MFRKIIAFTLLLIVAAACSKTDTTDEYSAVDKQKIDSYLAENGLTSEAKSTTTGLYYVIVEPGAAYHPNINSTVRVMYKGYLLDGTIFDQSTYSSSKPADFALSSGIIKGWKEGMQLVGVGGKIKLIIPSALGYGSVASTKIPANSVLVFDIEVVDIYN